MEDAPQDLQLTILGHELLSYAPAEYFYIPADKHEELTGLITRRVVSLLTGENLDTAHELMSAYQGLLSLYFGPDPETKVDIMTTGLTHLREKLEGENRPTKVWRTIRQASYEAFTEIYDGLPVA